MGRPPKYRWSEMEVGDSFLVTDKSFEAMRGVSRYQSARRGWTFDVAKTDDGVRVWRTA